MSCNAPSDLKTKLSATLYQSIFSVVGGELMDVEAAFMREISFDPILVSRYKTASYSCIGPLVSGAQWSDAPAEVIDTLTEFGMYAGIAFQLQDDLLGVFGDEAKTGKSTLTDLREAKATYLIQQYIATLDKNGLQDFRTVFGNESATDSELAALKANIAAGNAVALTEARINEFFEKSAVAAKSLPDEFRKEELLSLLQKLDQRSA
jgi:geranylgeranyl diphosphate synthase type II